MDAVIRQIQQGHTSFAILRAVLVLSFLCGLSATAGGQHLQIRSRDKNQEIVYIAGTGMQSFPEVQWDIHNSRQLNGVAVIWNIDAFERQGGGKSRQLTDSGLMLRIRSAGPNNAWRVVQAADQTNVAKGDQSANVSALCAGYGEATLGIMVTFGTDSSVMPAAGKYRTQLTGTITAP